MSDREFVQPATAASSKPLPTGMEASSSASSVDMYAPWAGPEERSLRVRIHRAQAVAAARAARETDILAQTLYSVAAELALSWVFRRAEDIADLERVLRALSQLFMAADNIVQVGRASAS